MAVTAAPVTPDRAAVLASARQQLHVLESAGAISLFGAAAQTYVDDLTVQRIDVEDIAVVGTLAVALMVQRGRRHDGTWVERRLSAVFGQSGQPDLFGSWVAGLDDASRA